MNPSVKYPHSSSVTIRSESGFRYLCKIGFTGSAFIVQGYFKKGSEVLGSAFKVIPDHPGLLTSGPLI
jgi:hypothetical protein